jgi:hypothetical protein
MGGYGSGRPAMRATVESARRLDIRRLHRLDCLQPGTAGTWAWTSDGERTGELQYRVGDDSLELRYAVLNDDDQSEELRFLVAIRSRPCRYGGGRSYFLCPHCCRPCEVIVMTTNGRRWGCRKCLRLRYQSQRLAPADRMQRRADRLYERAGTDYGATVVKHKWMRWRTYNRLISRANALSIGADAGFLYRLRRFDCGSIDELLYELE